MGMPEKIIKVYKCQDCPFQFELWCSVYDDGKSDRIDDEKIDKGFPINCPLENLIIKICR